MDKEPEVFDVKDMNGASPMQKGLAVFFVIMSLLYTASPIDLAPDAIPVVGWQIRQVAHGNCRRNRCAAARRFDRCDCGVGGKVI